MNNKDIFKALLDVIDIVVEHNEGPLMLGDIKFEMLKTGKVKPSHSERNWTVADSVNILLDLKEYLEEEFDLKENK